MVTKLMNQVKENAYGETPRLLCSRGKQATPQDQVHLLHKHKVQYTSRSCGTASQTLIPLSLYLDGSHHQLIVFAAVSQTSCHGSDHLYSKVAVEVSQQLKILNALGVLTASSSPHGGKSSNFDNLHPQSSSLCKRIPYKMPSTLRILTTLTPIRLFQ